MQEELRRIHRIEAVLLATELATHLDLAALSQNAFSLFSAQAAQHVGHAFAAAGAGKARAALALQGLEAQQLFFPEQAPQDGVHIQGQQLVAGQAGSQVGDTVVVFVVTNLVFVLAVRQPLGQIALALQRHALDQQARSHLAVGRQHQHGVQLLRLQHVVLQHIRQAFEFFVMVAVQRHHALVGLLAWQAVLGVQRDGATPAAAHIDHLAQPGIGSDVAVDGGGSAQAEVRLHLRHRHLHRAIPEHLQHQRAVELDVGLHQHTSRSHLAQQLLHGCGIGAGGRIAVAALQDLGPGIGQPHDHAAHGQAFKQKLVEFRHSGIPEKQK